MSLLPQLPLQHTDIAASCQGTLPIHNYEDYDDGFCASLNCSSNLSGNLAPLLGSSDGSALTTAWAGYGDQASGSEGAWRGTSLSPVSSTPLCLDSSTGPVIDEDIVAMLSVSYQLEAELRPDVDYLHRHASPPGCSALTADMRRMGLGWLVEVALDQGLTQEALSLAVSLLDRFMSLARDVRVTSFQMICTACLMIAAKHEEEVHPAMSEFASLSAGSFTEADLRAAEMVVLHTLGFRVNCPSLYTFLLLLNRALGVAPRTSALACYLTELAMLEYAMLAYSPSHVACSAMALAGLYFNEPLPLSAMHATMPFSLVALMPCIRALLRLHQAAHSAPPGTEAAVVRDKFRAYEWQGAGTVQPFARLPGSLLAGPWALVGGEAPPGKPPQ